jgi:hypothetical protein
MADRVVPKTVWVPPDWAPPGISVPFEPETGPSRMRRQNQMTHDEVIAYNLRGGGHEFTEFEWAQADRVLKARAIIERISELIHDRPRLTIVEPGCSTGDISGFFAYGNYVTGIDVTPGAAMTARDKWPEMTVIEERIENVAPIDCDILVLCEFLEHIIDPIAFVTTWLPKARYVVIGHPLVEDGSDPELGHPWAYYPVDYANWFKFGGHELREAWTFPMGYSMVIGWGARL